MWLRSVRMLKIWSGQSHSSNDQMSAVTCVTPQVRSRCCNLLHDCPQNAWRRQHQLSPHDVLPPHAPSAVDACGATPSCSTMGTAETDLEAKIRHHVRRVWCVVVHVCGASNHSAVRAHQPGRLRTVCAACAGLQQLALRHRWPAAACSPCQSGTCCCIAHHHHRRCQRRAHAVVAAAASSTSTCTTDAHARIPRHPAPRHAAPAPPHPRSQQLVQSGERERLKQLLRDKLTECGWRDEVKQRARGVGLCCARSTQHVCARARTL
jgi:hypothetical protein